MRDKRLRRVIRDNDAPRQEIRLLRSRLGIIYNCIPSFLKKGSEKLLKLYGYNSFAEQMFINVRQSRTYLVCEANLSLISFAEGKFIS